MVIKSYRDLKIWQISVDIIKEIYNITSKGKFNSDYGFRDHTRRTSISISNNIVEGFEKNNNNEFIRYLGISEGSNGELRNLLDIALMIEYINKEDYDRIMNKLENLKNQVGGFIKYLKTKRTK